MPQPLNSKDAASFRQLVKLYEAKQYKKSIKAADQILKKNPNHGDTLAMKALTMNSQGQTTEAFELAKTALKADMKSHICWHVYGLLHRGTKQYDEAVKAYKFALKLEPDSVQIQRDLAFLQAQIRDFTGYIESRKAMLQAKPAIRQNWTALAVAYHLNGDLEAAEKHLVAYENTLKTPPPRTDVEHSEAQLYRNSILEEMGDAEKALEHLDTIYKTNLDRTAVMEARARYLLKLGRKEDAEKAYRELVERNNEYRPYYEGLEQALGLDRSKPADVTKLAELYQSLVEDNERLDAARRIPLDFLEGDAFKKAADSYLRRMLTKGVPSTFPNIKALYSNPSKLETIQALVEGYTPQSVTTNGTEKQTNGDSSDKFALARYYFLAQHYNYPRSRNLKKATENIDKALELKPKAVDYHMTKARILKHTGNLAKASETMNFARELDEKDRYINTKCAKYQLRNNENENALKTMSKFTRNETVGGALGDLHDMQCMWFITEDGEANLRQEKLSLALKRFKAIYDIFDIWQEDQFDFHHFSIRKGQIRAYVDMMRWEDRLREHPFYARAAINAIKIYLMLYDNPDLAHGQTNGVDLSNLNAADKKKALKKIKKEQERVAKEEAEKREAEKKANPPKKATGGDGEAKKEDPDPQGLTLLETKAPLDEAVKFLAPLLEYSPKNVAAQNIGFEVYLRRHKFLLALKCLTAVHSLDPDQSKLHEQIVRFRVALDSLSEPLPEKVSKVLESTSTFVPAKSNLISYNDKYLSKHKDCARRTQSALRTRQLLNPQSLSSNEKDLLATLELSDITMEEAVEGLQLLKDWKSDAATSQKYTTAARKKWHDATAFEEKK